MTDDKKPDLKKIHEEAIDRFKASVDADRDDRELRLDDLKFAAGNSDNGYQWPDNVRSDRASAVGGARPCLTINRLSQHIRQVTNEMRRNRPSIKVRPVNDKGDPKVAEVIAGLVRHTENNRNETYSGANVAITTAAECQVTSGVGYFAIRTDYCDEDGFDQDIFWQRIRNPFSIYDDPDIQTPDGRDRRFLFETTFISEDEFEERYPDAKPIDWEAPADERAASWFDRGSKKVRIAKYWKVASEYRTVKSGDKTRKIAQRKVVIYTLNGGEVIETEQYPGRFIPFVRLVGNEWDIDGKMEVSGLTRNSKDAQRQYNYWASAEVEMLALAPRAPFIAPIESIEEFADTWQTANRVNHSYLPYRAMTETGQLLPPPQRAQPPLPPAGFIHAKQGASDDIKATTGQYDASLGNRSNEQSGRAIIARQSEGDMATMHYMDNLGFAMEYAGSIILDLIPHVYDTARVIRIIGEDDVEDQASIDPALSVAVKKVAGKNVYNLAIGKYDVVVSAGPSFSTKRQEGLEFLTAIGQTAPAIGAAAADLLVKLADVPYGDEIAKRVKALLPPQVLQAIEQDESDGEQAPPSPELNRMKQALGEAMGRLQAAEQGVQERDAELQKLQTVVSTKSNEAEHKHATAALHAETERVRAQADQLKAQAEVEKAQLQVDAARLAYRQQLVTAGMAAADAENAQIMDEGEDGTVVRGPVADAMRQNGELMAALMGEIAQRQDQLLAVLAQPKGPKVLSLKGPSGNAYEVVIQ